MAVTITTTAVVPVPVQSITGVMAALQALLDEGVPGEAIVTLPNELTVTIPGKDFAGGRGTIDTPPRTR